MAEPGELSDDGSRHAAAATAFARRAEARESLELESLILFGSAARGDASREQGRFLNDLSTLRKQADDGYEPVDEDVESLLERARSFVETMGDLVDES